MSATKSRLERELAEAVMEDNDKPDHASSSLVGSSEDLPSDSDSECGDVPYPLPIQHSNSIEASLLSVNFSAPSSVETSVYEDTEVIGRLSYFKITQQSFFKNV